MSNLGGEPLAATASRVDHWILIEYRARWARDAVAASVLSPELKEHLRRQLEALSHARLLFVKKRERGAEHGTHAFFGTSRPGRESLFRLELEHADELLRVDFVDALAGRSSPPTPALEAVDGPLYVVCTHGKRDRCCALHGRPLYDALRHATESDRVWQSTHVGGDRFAGNVVVLPHGLYYGRVGPADVEPLLSAHAAGRLDLERYRGRSAYSFPVQAAERALRDADALDGIDDVELVGFARIGDGRRRVRLRTPDAAVHELDVVESVADEPTYLTCESDEPRRARRWLVSADDAVSR
jgi:hypothetical protein